MGQRSPAWPLFHKMTRDEQIEAMKDMLSLWHINQLIEFAHEYVTWQADKMDNDEIERWYKYMKAAQPKEETDSG